MMGEDYRSQAIKLMDYIYGQNQTIADLQETVSEKNKSIIFLEDQKVIDKEIFENQCMTSEEVLVYYTREHAKIVGLEETIERMKQVSS